MNKLNKGINSTNLIRTPFMNEKRSELLTSALKDKYLSNKIKTTDIYNDSLDI